MNLSDLRILLEAALENNDHKLADGYENIIKRIESRKWYNTTIELYSDNYINEIEEKNKKL